MNSIKLKLSKLKNPIKAKLLAGFFKTGVGQYGEGDIFWGITVPEQRCVARDFLRDISYGRLDDGRKKALENKAIFKGLQKLLKEPVHECRLTALLILTYMYAVCEKKDDDLNKKKIFDFYVKNIKYVNNWDLVDVTCPRIVGTYLFNEKTVEDRDLLYKLAKSKNIWEKRIAIISTLYFIKQNVFSDTLKIAEILLSDNHDLLHKAVGWMLREVGKKDEVLLHNFLKKHNKEMARTTLRYSIERLPDEFKKHYMVLKNI